MILFHSHVKSTYRNISFHYTRGCVCSWTYHFITRGEVCAHEHIISLRGEVCAHEHIISLRGEVCAHKTSHFFIEVLSQANSIKHILYLVLYILSICDDQKFKKVPNTVHRLTLDSMFCETATWMYMKNHVVFQYMYI